jgi:hypothetical protein
MHDTIILKQALHYTLRERRDRSIDYPRRRWDCTDETGRFHEHNNEDGGDDNNNFQEKWCECHVNILISFYP